MKSLNLENQFPASTWLDVLNTEYPVTGAIVIGAGTGQGPWVEWLAQREIRPIWLWEGEEKQFQHLQKNVSLNNGWHLHKGIVVSDDEVSSHFYQASNPWESGLLEPTQLKSVWPNLYSTYTEPVNDGVTLKDLFQASSSAVNWLVIDCLPAALLLKNAKNEIDQLDMAVVRVLLQDEPVSASVAQVDLIMQGAGMRRLQLLPERHPSLAYAIYVRDHAGKRSAQDHEIKQLNLQLLHTKNEMKSLTEEYALKLASIKSQIQQQEIQQLKEECAKQTLTLSKIETLNETARNKQQSSIEQIIASLEKLNHQNDINDLISKIISEQEKQYQLVEKVQAAIGEQSRQQEQRHKEWPNVLKRELINRLGNTVRQIESFITIQSYLTTGEGITGFHGWPISADIGLFLLEKIKEQQYDAIIEFGSGTSTLLMAKALKALNINNSNDSKRIITFEHHEDYFLRTQRQLSIHNVDNLVELCLTPIKEWSDTTGDYFYYDCAANIKQLAQVLHGEKKKILVLVDGPPGDTCAHARYPVAPFLIDLTKQHEIHWVLDDAYRPEEMESAKLWIDLWNQNGISFVDEFIKNEKGMFYLITNS